MVLFTVHFLGGGSEDFPVRLPLEAEPGQVIRIVRAVAARKWPGKHVTKIVATRSETVLWQQ